MSYMGQTGSQVHPDDLTAPPLESDELIVIHYGGHTACTTTLEAAARLGLQVMEWRREFAGLVDAGHFVLRTDGAYDAAGVGIE